MHGALPHEVKHLLVRVRVVLYTWAHAYYYSPRTVRCENEHGVVNSTELGVHSGLHLMPLIQLDGVLGDGGAEGGGRVTVESIPLGELGLMVHAIWFHEGLHVAEGLLQFVLDGIEEGEVRAGRKVGSHDPVG